MVTPAGQTLSLTIVTPPSAARDVPQKTIPPSLPLPKLLQTVVSNLSRYILHSLLIFFLALKSVLRPPKLAPSAWQLYFTDWIQKQQASGTRKLNVAQAAKEAGQEYACLSNAEKEVSILSIISSFYHRLIISIALQTAFPSHEGSSRERARCLHAHPHS